MLVVVMGVSGCGKSTVGKELSQQMKCKFIDGDDLHPSSNVEKMSKGIPLTDGDRVAWLNSIHHQLCEWHAQGAHGVVACSALKLAYRNRLRSDLAETVWFLHLKGSIDTIRQRVLARTGHYMPPSLLQSQFDTLEDPKDEARVYTASIELSPSQ